MCHFHSHLAQDFFYLRVLVFSIGSFHLWSKVAAIIATFQPRGREKERGRVSKFLIKANPVVVYITNIPLVGT